MGGEKHWPSQAEKALDVKAEKNAARAEDQRRGRRHEWRQRRTLTALRQRG